MSDKISICHIVDNEKFILEAYYIFNGQKQYKSDFFCFEGSDKIDFLSKEAGIRKLNLDEVDAFIEQILPAYSVVIFHNFIRDYKFEILKSLDKNQVSVWIGWGYDFYKYFENNSFLTKENQAFVNGIYCNSFLKKAKQYFKLDKLKYAINYYFNYRPKLLLLSKRIDFYAPVAEYEFGFFKQKIPSTTFKYIGWNYPINLNCEDIPIAKTETVNLLVGNSASPLNNHCDVVKLLSEFKLDFNAYVPLSYGGDDLYKKALVEYSNIYLGQRFKPLEAFMGIDEYIKLLNNCQIGIFNSLRQQGLGNIIYLLWHGSKVFMNPMCHYYDFLLTQGVIVFDVKTFSSKDFYTPLTLEEKSKNKQKMIELYGKEVAQEKTKNLLDEVVKKATLKKQNNA